MAKKKQDDQLEHTNSSYVRIRDVALKTCQKLWMIGRSGERGSGISVLAARHDDDDDYNSTRMDLPLNNPQVDMSLNKETKPNYREYAVRIEYTINGQARS